MNNSSEIFASLLNVVPNATLDDINSLIADISDIYDKDEHQEQQPDKWTPSKHTVLELININVQPKDIIFCITDFRSFAETKGWTINDNLDAKLISHVKIMEKNKRISFSIPE